MDAMGHTPRAARLLTWVLLVALAAHTAQLLGGRVPAGAGETFEKCVSNLVFLGAAVLA